MKNLNKQIDLFILILYMRMKERKRNSWMKNSNKQIDLFILILYMRMKEGKKWNSWMIKMNKQKHWPISRYNYNKLLVCESDITIFVQIRLTEEWSCFSRMMLWWSVGSASTVVLIQCISNVKMNCMWL